MSSQNTELKMAMSIAAHTWPGTSIAEGAMRLLDEIYGPHEHIFSLDHDGAVRCTRCGKQS